jgi:hypothetical protein
MIEFNSFIEFNQAVIGRDIKFITSVVNTVIDAIDNNKERVTIFSTPDILGDEVLSFTLSKDQYKKLLERALTDFENEEMYEECGYHKKKYINKL